MQVGSLKSSTLGGSPGEFILEELGAAAKAAGWQVDTLRVALAAGEKKAVNVT